MKERLYKSKILLIITTMAKMEDGKMRAIKKEYKNVRGRDLEISLKEESAANTIRPLEMVYEEPTKISIGTLYVLYGGKRIWVYKMEDNND